MTPTTRGQAAREAVATSDVHSARAITEEQQQSNIRMRQDSSTQFASVNGDAASTTSSRRSTTPDEPPRFIIDLSLPPEQRYLELCAAFKDEMLNLTSLFDEVVGDMIQFIPVKWLRIICKIFLRKVHNKEEQVELRGISKASGVEMYLLVCFNVLLDLFMGCSSGGAVVRAGEETSSGSKMVHFRTLDWGMPALRRVVVQLDYVEEKDGPVIASSITYAGFVGVLTGVRKDLSISLNFRPNRIDNGMFWADVKYGWHHLMVLLGRRPSISSTLRHFLLPHRDRKKLVPWLPFTKAGEKTTFSYSEVIKRIGGENGTRRPMTTTACYLCFCNGTETTTLEKDRISATVRSSSEFIVVTNTDETSTLDDADAEKKDSPPLPDTYLQEMAAEAKDRQQCAFDNCTNMRAAKARRRGMSLQSKEDLSTLLEVDDVVEMVQKYPTTNECTHFACVMDPTQGKVSWCRRWRKPVTAKWIREHMSDTW